MPGQGREMGTCWNMKRLLATRPQQTGTVIARFPLESEDATAKSMEFSLG